MRVVIPFPLPGPNEYIKAERGHRQPRSDRHKGKGLHDVQADKWRCNRVCCAPSTDR